MKHRIIRIVRIAAAAVLGAALIAAVPGHRSPVTAVSVVVYKDPNCGCCTAWVEHLRKHGFQVAVRDTNDVTGAKKTARVPERLYSCHTAFVSGYVVEGHVPAADIQRMLDEKPRIAGIGVGGMPIGSPGMEMGNRKDKYDVLAFNRDGTTQLFARH